MRLHVPDRLQVGNGPLRNLDGAHGRGERAGAPVLQVQTPVLDEAGEVRRHLRDDLHPVRARRRRRRPRRTPGLRAVAAAQRRRPDDEEEAFSAAGPVQHGFPGASRFLCVQFGVVQVASLRPVRRLGSQRFRRPRPHFRDTTPGLSAGSHRLQWAGDCELLAGFVVIWAFEVVTDKVLVGLFDGFLFDLFGDLTGRFPQGWWIQGARRSTTRFWLWLPSKRQNSVCPEPGRLVRLHVTGLRADVLLVGEFVGRQATCPDVLLLLLPRRGNFLLAA